MDNSNYQTGYQQPVQQHPQQPTGFVTNSSADEMDALIESGGKQEGKPKFDEKRYLNTRLKDGENKRTVRIRLLPITADSSKCLHKQRHIR